MRLQVSIIGQNESCLQESATALPQWKRYKILEEIIIIIISYLGMKSWDLQVCDRASMITHVDREKKNSAYQNNKIFYFFLV